MYHASNIFPHSDTLFTNRKLIVKIFIWTIIDECYVTVVNGPPFHGVSFTALQWDVEKRRKHLK